MNHVLRIGADNGLSVFRRHIVWRWIHGTFDRADIDTDRQLGFAASEHHATHRTDLAVVASQANGEVVGGGEAGGGGIEFDPADLTAGVNGDPAACDCIGPSQIS